MAHEANEAMKGDGPSRKENGWIKMRFLDGRLGYEVIREICIYTYAALREPGGSKKMTVYTKSFVKYSLFHNAKAPSNQFPTLQAQITCSDASYNQVAYLWFHRSDTVPDSYVSSDGRLNLYFPIERLQEIITTLRYEKPLKATIVTDASGKAAQAYLAANEPEPVGEQEGV